MIRGATALLLFVLSPVGALASATFTAQVDRNGAPITSVIASAPSFNVSFVSASHDTVIVEVKIIGSQVGQGGCAQSTLPRCSWFQVTYNLNPCPVDFVGAEYSLWEYCTGANLRYVRYFESVPDRPIRFALVAGVPYTISGGVGYIGGLDGNGVLCGETFWCTDGETGTSLVYVAAPVATMPVTWGKIKALYRTP